MAAGTVLYLRGVTLDLVTIAGLMMALGIIIDDAIVDVQNIAQRLRQARDEGSDKSAATIVLEAAFEVRSPLVYATVIIALAVVPLLALDGVAGSIFQPLAMSYLLAVLASMLVALTVTPALCVLLLRNGALTAVISYGRDAAPPSRARSSGGQPECRFRSSSASVLLSSSASRRCLSSGKSRCFPTSRKPIWWFGWRAAPARPMPP